MSGTPSVVVPGVRAGTVREAWALAWPTVLGQATTTLMWTVDTLLLGNVGKVELAAAGFGGVLIWTLYTFFVGLVRAVDTFVSQAAGAEQPREAGRFAWQGLWIAAASTVVLAVVWWRFPDLLALAGPDPAVISECLVYSRARLLGAGFVLGGFALQGFFRGVGDVRAPMVVAVVANVLNAGLDVLLIYGVGPFPRLTTAGAGYATAVASLASFLMLLAWFLRPAVHRLYSTRDRWRPHRPSLRRLLRVGAPMGLQSFGDMGSFSVFLAIMGRLGTDQLAASHIAVQVLSFSFMPASGVSRAATTLVGQYLGAGRPELARRAGWVTLRMVLVYTLGVGLLLLLLRDYVVLGFNRDPAVVAAGVAILPLLALFQLFDGVQMVSSAALQGAGDTTVPMIVFLSSSWLLFLPLTWALAYPAGWGITGAWLAGVVHFGLIAAFLLIRFARGGWQRRRV